MCSITKKAKGPVPEGLELHHKCENPPCVNPKHLKPVTHKINMRLNRHTKLNEIKVRKIRKLSAQGMSYLEIAKLFGVGESTVGHAVLGNRNWKDVK